MSTPKHAWLKIWWLSCALVGSALCNTSVSAQAAADGTAVELSEPPQIMSTTTGGMPEEHTYIYTSPLKKIGLELGFGSYVVSALVGLIYVIDVYPLANLFGSMKFEPVMPWLMVPIAGPLIAQYQDHVVHKPGWRAVLIGDAALQASGLIIGVLGVLLSGERTREPGETGGLELHLGVAGMGMTGLTVSLRTF
jgi:hypothetical protein